MCTALSIVSKQKEVYFGRTMDFWYPLDPELYIVPKNYKWHSSISSNIYTNKYSFIGIGQPIEELHFADGMNEKGLGVAALYFPGYAYFHTKIDENKISIASVEMVTYLLSTCANISDVISIAPSLHLVGTKDLITNTIAPLHWIVADKSGNTVTIEHNKTGLHILENPIGVLANSPDFSWHYTNLRNYMNVSPNSPSPKKWSGVTLTQFGQGGGTFGLPGDFTSPSRFIRISFAKSYLELPESREETLLACFHLMKLVSIPKGIITTNNNLLDYTQYTTFMNLNTGDYYFNTYYNEEIKYANILDNKTDKILSLGKLKKLENIQHI